MKNTSLIPLLAAVVLLSCQSAENTGEREDRSDALTRVDSTRDTSGTSLTGSRWILTTLEGQKIADRGISGEPIHFTLNSENTAVGGYTGCNRFHGTYKLQEGRRIRFTPMASTKMACHDNPVDEREFLKIFELADNYSLHGDTLTLNVGRRAPLAVFVKTDKYENPITEKYWKLTMLNGMPATMAENQERERYFILRTQPERLEGFAGCNSFSGLYQISGDTEISFSDIAVTLKACPDVDVDDGEFLEVFESADNYDIKGDALRLNAGKGAPLAEFEAVYFD